MKFNSIQILAMQTKSDLYNTAAQAPPGGGKTGTPPPEFEKII